MKRVGTICLCLAGGLVLNAGLRAENAGSPADPYAAIAKRNVFALNPPPPPGPAVPAVPPPKITLNGFFSVYGRSQAMYKVAIPPRPGQPGKDQSYMLSEGQAEDDIEVTKIDEAAGTVTFNNHGTVQELPLANAPAGGTSAPAPGGPGPGPVTMPRPGFPMPGGAPVGGNANNNVIRFGNRFGQSGGFNVQNPTPGGGNNFNGGMNGGANSGSRLGVALGGGGGGYSSSQSSTQPQVTMSPDEQQALIAYQHAQSLNGQNPVPPNYWPPTKYDSQAGVPNSLMPPSSGGPPSK